MLQIRGSEDMRLSVVINVLWQNADISVEIGNGQNKTFEYYLDMVDTKLKGFFVVVVCFCNCFSTWHKNVFGAMAHAALLMRVSDWDNDGMKKWQTYRHTENYNQVECVCRWRNSNPEAHDVYYIQLTNKVIAYNWTRRHGFYKQIKKARLLHTS